MPPMGFPIGKNMQEEGYQNEICKLTPPLHSSLFSIIISPALSDESAHFYSFDLYHENISEHSAAPAFKNFPFKTL